MTEIECQACSGTGEVYDPPTAPEYLEADDDCYVTCQSCMGTGAISIGGPAFP